jgi:type IV pilus assembly protein PilB
VSKFKGKRAKLGRTLIAAGAIEPDQLTAALEEQKRSGGLLGMALVRMGFVDERTLVRALAGQLELPVIQLKDKRIGSEVLDLVPVELVEKHRCLPLLINGEGDARVLYLGMEDPSHPDVVAEICTLVGMNVQAVLVAPTELDEGIFRHYQCDGFGTKPLSDSLSTTTLAATQSSTAAVAPATQSIDPNTDDMEASTLDEFGPEPSFVGLEELGPEDSSGPLEFVDSPALPSGEPTEKAGGASASSEAMLRAIAQLLVEKGVFTRDELVEHLLAIPRSKGGA